jgi:hypothetical protein
VSPFAAEALAEGPHALTQDPVCGIDGKLAPVVGWADDAQAPGAVSRHEERHGVRDLVGASRPHLALFGRNDVTGLDAFEALDALVADDRLGSAVRVGVRSEEGPREIVMRSDLVAGGVEGFARVLEGLLRAVP